MTKSIHFTILFVLSIGIASAQGTKGDPTVGWTNMLKQMDKNKDGKISHDEFMSIYKKMPPKLRKILNGMIKMETA